MLPEKSEPKHLLWMLYFLKVYPREGPRCSAVGELKGAVDPKKMQKWVWLFLKRIAELANHVASCFVPSPRRQLSSHLLLVVVAFLPKSQIMFKSCLVNDIRNNCLMTIDGTDFKILQKGAAKKGNVFGSHKYAGKSALHYKLGIDINPTKVEGIDNAPVIICHLSNDITAVTVIRLIITNSFNLVHTKKYCESNSH
jgi:hypothetical protein